MMEIVPYTVRRTWRCKIRLHRWGPIVILTKIPHLAALKTCRNCGETKILGGF